MQVNKANNSMLKQTLKKVLLIILDGFGVRDEEDNNAIAKAYTPHLNKYNQLYPHTTLVASGEEVGLPAGQFGNSEVGHLNIGAGRIVRQDISRIDFAIKNDQLKNNQALQSILDGNYHSNANNSNHNINNNNNNINNVHHDSNSVNNNHATEVSSGVVHILGLLSDGGVHSHINHVLALTQLCSMNANIKKVWLHVFLDGRDTPPRSALKYLKQTLEFIKDMPKVAIATVSGRYYAMDRDKRYDRVLLAYEAITLAKSKEHFANAILAVENAYRHDITDEFVVPTIIDGYHAMGANDNIIFANFRSDRAIQLTEALLKPNEFSFPDHAPLNALITMTTYKAEFTNQYNVKVLFPPNIIRNTFGEYVANLGLTQLRIAETEKYPHVTYFFNGGNQNINEGETRILIDSPRDVATYDLKPEMSLEAVSKSLVEAINSNQYDVIITNFANGDMVGHSGKLSAAIKAVEALDQAVGAVVTAMQNAGGEVLIVADHGNCEQMFDYVNQQPHTQHTSNLVPCLYITKEAAIKDIQLKEGGSLQDVAPTLLAMAGLDKPAEMTGNSLITHLAH